jgi:hypothetical protein
MVDEFTGLAKLQIDHASAAAAMALCQGDDLFLECAIAVLGRFLGVGAGTHADNTQATAFAQPMTDHIAHQFASGWCAHHFFLKAYLNTSFSKIAHCQ